MIKSVTITNYLGDSIELELTKPEKSGFLVYRIDGLGPVKANISSGDISTGDGARYNNARVPVRNIVLGIAFHQTNGISVEELRHKSYKYFPSKKLIELRIKTDTRTLRIKGYIESNEPDIFTSMSATQISIVCMNPFFHSISPNTTIFYGINPEFEFPFSNESLTDNLLEMGSIQNRTENLIQYSGDVETGVTINIHAMGDVKNLTIFNITTRDKMFIDTDKLKTLTGSAIIAKDELILNTNKGEKSLYLLREGVRTNILSCLGKESKWFVISKGDNIFAFDAEEGTTNLQLRITNDVLYEGV